MKKQNIIEIKNCKIYPNKNQIIEEWLEPGSERKIGITKYDAPQEERINKVKNLLAVQVHVHHRINPFFLITI